MNQGSGLGLFVLLLVTAGLVAWVAGLGLGGDSWSPRSYVPADGDCWVPPQGDPLYDAHYAQEVNSYNCGAFKVQSESKFIDAQTDAAVIQNQQARLGTSAILFIFVAVITLLFLMALKR